MSAGKRQAESADESDEDEPQVVHADVKQYQKGWLLRVPNELAQTWHDRNRVCERYRTKQRELEQSKRKDARLEAEVQTLKRSAESQCVLGTLEVGDTQTKRGTESRGTFYDASGREQFSVESEGAFFTLAPHLRILTETDVFHEDGERTKRMKVAAAVAGHYVIKPNASTLQAKAAGRAEIIDHDEGERNHRPLQQHEINQRQAKVVERRQASSAAKTTAGDKDEVRNKILELFKGEPLWAFKDLKEKTQQPENHLKNILQDLCDYEQQGENKGKYQLKSEFR